MVLEWNIRGCLKLAGLVVFLLIGQLWGQTELDLSVKASLRSRDPLAEVQYVPTGQRIEVSFVVPKVRLPSLRVTPPNVARSMLILGGPYISPVIVADNDGTEHEYTKITYIYRTRDIGVYIFDPYKVSDGIDQYATKRKLLQVHQGDVVPPNLRWRIDNTRPFIGQTIPLTLELYNAQEIRIPETRAAISAAGLIFEEAAGLGQISEEELDGVTLYTIPVREFYLTPSQPGRLFIPETTVVIDGRRIRAGAVQISAYSLPANGRQNSAVGQFSFESSINTDTMHIDEDAKITMILEGIGNFSYLEFPELKGENFIIKDTIVKEDLQAADKGFTGRIEKTYIISAKEEGDISVQVPSFVWYDPEIKESKRIDGIGYSIAIDTSDVIDSLDFGGVEIELIPSSEWWRYTELKLFLNPLFYLFLLPGFLVLLGLILKQRGFFAFLATGLIFTFFGCKANYEQAYLDSVIETAHEYFAAGNFSEVNRLYTQFSDEWNNNAAVWYNRGVAAYYDDKPADAVYSFKQALKIRPHEEQFHLVLDQIEKHFELDRQIPRPFFLHIDEIVIILVAAINILCILSGIMYIKNNSILVVSFALMWLVIFACGLGVGTYFLDSMAERAIILEADVPLKTIPEAVSGNYLRLKAGSNVYIGYTKDEYVLVKTVYGRQGWVRSVDVIRE